MLDGGAGRVLTSIPALLKYQKNHPDEEWYIMVNWWDFLLWGIPELQERTFNVDTNGSFDIFWVSEKIITPEPYRVPKYFRNEISLIEAFDIEINRTVNHDDLPEMVMVLSLPERRIGYEIVESAKKKFKKDKTIVIQPYGSGAFFHPTGVHDDTLRSIPAKMLEYYIQNLLNDYNIIYMGFDEFYDERIFKPENNINLREWAAVIDAADYFIGCDSCGQHICKALNKPASVFIAGTHRKNVTYENFHIIEKDIPFYPDAMRISDFRSRMSHRLNEQRIYFTDEEIENSYRDIINNIKSI